MKNSLFIVLCALICLMSACVKDKTIFTPDQGNAYKSDILGLVLDEDNNPVESATVTYRGVSQKTDKNGVYSFKNVDISTRHSTLAISKDGYFNGNRVFSVSKASSTVKLKSILLKKEFRYSFQSQTGTKINTSDKVSLNFGEASIMVEATGADYNGVVQVAVKHINPSSDNLVEEMPGNLSAINSNQQMQILTTYGMVAVELRSPTGEKLNVKTGKQVEMSVEVPASLLSKAPANIPLWHFDENTGYWMEDGSATLENGRYTGNVSHFSFWNYDSQRPSVIVSGRVIDQNGNPVSGVHIWFTVPGDYSGGHGNTNDDGTFSGPIAQDEILDVTIYTYQGCSAGTLYTGQVGPFSNDVTLPDIVVTIPNPNVLSVTGIFNDCDGNPVQDGYVIVRGGLFTGSAAIINGQVNTTFVICDPLASYNLKAVDRIGLKQTDAITLTAPGNNDLGTVTVCDAEVDNITVDCPNLTFHEVIIDTIEIGLKNTTKHLTATTLTSGRYVSVYLTYDDGDAANYAPGTYNLTGANVYNFDNNQNGWSYHLFPGATSGTITIAQGGAPGSLVTGTFSFVGRIDGTVIEETFTGTFRIHSN